jgi:TDG/mug DNA glycosylase family protein
MPVLKDQIDPRVRVLFVGINPGLRSAAVGHHFAGPTNRFWRLLFESGLVPEPLTFADDGRLPEWGYGLTNIIARATRGSSELTRQDYERGARVLLRKIVLWRPEILAPVGVSVWRALARAIDVPGIDREPVTLGVQPHRVERAQVYVLPNPSGRNAHLSYAEMLAAYRGLRELLKEHPDLGAP